jgi:threonine/homoserine/homoserine lactone efflux protein
MAWIFWITVCTPQAMGLESVLHYGRWVFILLFEIGWLSSTLLLANFTERFRAYFQANKKLHLLSRTVAVFFLFFGVKLIVESAMRLLG